MGLEVVLGSRGRVEQGLEDLAVQPLAYSSVVVPDLGWREWLPSIREVRVGCRQVPQGLEILPFSRLDRGSSAGFRGLMQPLFSGRNYWVYRLALPEYLIQLCHARPQISVREEHVRHSLGDARAVNGF